MATVKLSTFFERIGPYLEGRATVDDTRRLLYRSRSDSEASSLSLPPEGPDAERLAIYGRFCRISRVHSLAGIYVYARAEILRAAGEARWQRLVDEYFAAHPMHHVELSENAAALPSFLEHEADLPPHLPVLADFEWWEWRTRIALDDTADAAPDRGPPRLASTVELRPYRYDLIAWLDEPGPSGERAPSPEARESLVLFWRDLDLDPRREPAQPIELAVLRAIFVGGSLSVPTGIDAADFREALDDLHAAGIVLGEMP